MVVRGPLYRECLHTAAQLQHLGHGDGVVVQRAGPGPGPRRGPGPARPRGLALHQLRQGCGRRRDCGHTVYVTYTNNKIWSPTEGFKLSVIDLINLELRAAILSLSKV